MNRQISTLKNIPFDVHIPNLDGDGIAETIRIEVQARIDPENGEEVLTPESIELIEKTQARHMGLLSAEEIKALRTQLGLSQDELSKLLQIGAKTYTRWESGRARPSRSMNLMLCALRDGQLNLNYLRALCSPSAGAEWQARNRCFYRWSLYSSHMDIPSKRAHAIAPEDLAPYSWSALDKEAIAGIWSSSAFNLESPRKATWSKALRMALQRQPAQRAPLSKRFTASSTALFGHPPPLPRASFGPLIEDPTASS